MLLSTMSFSAVLEQAGAETFGDYYYELINSDTEVEITGYLGPGGNIAIPNEIDGKPVTSIGTYAFQSTPFITSVTIGGGITNIGGNAFSGCTDLTEINVDAANAIYASADGVLYDKAMIVLIQCPGGKAGSVTIPGSVVSVGNSSFEGCTSLISVIILDSVTSLGRSAFSGCTALTSVKIGERVRSIESNTFAGCTALSSVTIPRSVTSIGQTAFASCSSLSSVTIPNGVQYIYDLAFVHCSSLASVTIPGSVKSIWNDAFAYCSSLRSVTISNGLETLGEYAFAYCPSLTSVTIPGTVTSVGPSVFRECTSLTSVTMSEGTTVIGKSEFYQCTALTSVTIPGSVTTLSDSAFYNCSGLTSITFEGNAPMGFTSCFTNHNPSLVIYYHAGATGFTNPWYGIPTAALTSNANLPGAPRELTATPGIGQVQLSWAAPSTDSQQSIVGYHIYWSEEQNNGYSPISVNTTSYLHSGLEDGRTYYYRVTAISQAGEGATSAIVSVTTANASSLPSVPGDLEVVVNGETVRLTWKEPSSDGGSAITGYMIYRGTSASDMEYVATVTGTSYEVEGLGDGDHYYYEVHAINGNGIGLPTSPVDIKNAASKDGSTDNLPIEYLALGGVGAVVACMAGVLLLRRRPALKR
ncbi:MAG: fibronectin type III domain-containing protein [Methanomassiliicoccus sp.]|nr:fibronectin type III domain-containing protein [Methanomassiliicoccus sp.]